MSDQLPPPPVPATPPVPAATAPVVTDQAPLSFTCPTCGSQTAYAPGTTMLRCGACGTETAIAPSGAAIVEHSYDAWISAPHKPVAQAGAQMLRCQNCGATSESSMVATLCQFCNGALVAATQPEGVIAPEAVLPFHVDTKGASSAFKSWVGSRRFAPNALKKVGSTQGLTGTYLPHWTYDAHTETDYTGERGDYYYVTVQVQVSDGKGGTRTESRQERRTRWRHASGHVNRAFDDVLVPASSTLTRKALDKMGPWTLGDALPFQPAYLAGYSAVRYDLDPDAGLVDARQQMTAVIDGDVKRDIGGDEQRVGSLDVAYAATMFKLMLMPLWIASYLYAGKTYQVMVNANTGEVVGDRPYSKLKIALAVIAALIVIAVVVGIVAASKGSSS